MQIDFSNKWFRESCAENGLNPDNELSQSAVQLARDRAVDMKKNMDALRNYEHLDNDDLNSELQERINKLNNERIGHMLDAVAYAEVMNSLGDGFNEFVKKQVVRKERTFARRGHSTLSLSPIEKRVNERWERAMKRTEG